MKRLFICRRSLAPSEKKQERKEERGPTYTARAARHGKHGIASLCPAAAAHEFAIQFFKRADTAPISNR